MPQLARRHALRALAVLAFEDILTLRIRLMLRWAFFALPFQVRQCRRSTSATITAFAGTRAGSPVDKFAAASFVCCRRIAIWNQSKIGGFVTPASARTVRRPGQPSVKAVTSVVAVRPTVSRVRWINAVMSVWVLATAPKTYRPPVSVSTLPTRTSRCRSPSSQLRMNVESRVTATAAAAISGPATASIRSVAPIFRVCRRTVSGILSGINREYLLQHVSGHPVRHIGGEMRLKLVEFRRRAAMRRPSNASLDRATPSTAKTGKTHRDLAKMRRDSVVPVVVQVTNATTASALWPLNRVVPGLGGYDLLWEPCQYLLPVGNRQTQIDDIVKISRSVDRLDVGKRLVTVSPDLHQPHNPSHASAPGPITDAKIPLWHSHPQTRGGPGERDDRC